jgi:hypothetical protein
MDINVGSSGEENVEVRTKPKKLVKRPDGATAAKVRNGKGGLVSNLIAAGVTALVVGGGIYAWQSRVGRDKIEGARQQVQETKQSYEQRLESIKGSLSVAENERSEFKKQTENLLGKLGILNKAKIEFAEPAFGLSFEYPASLGEFTLAEATSTDTGKLEGKWSDTDKLAAGGSGDAYAPASTSSPLQIILAAGFAKEKNDYFLLGPAGIKLAVKPSQVLAIDGGEAIIIDGKGLAETASGTPKTDIGGNIAAVVNLKTGPVKGLAIVNSDFGVLPMDDFIAMVKSLKIK